MGLSRKNMKGVLLRLFLVTLMLQSCQSCCSCGSCCNGNEVAPAMVVPPLRGLLDAPTSICSFGTQKLQELNYFSVRELGCHKIDDGHISMLTIWTVVCSSKPDEESRLTCAKLGEEDFKARISDLPGGGCSCREAELASDYIESVLDFLNCD